jgi:hypothetical protein
LHRNDPPEPPVEPKAKEWAKSFLAQPSQYDLNKPHDYTCCLKNQVQSSKTGGSSASGERDVAQLGKHAKQSVSPLKVLPSQDPLTVFASEASLSLTQLLSKDIPTDLAWTYKNGERLVRPEKKELDQCQRIIDMLQR